MYRMAKNKDDMNATCKEIVQALMAAENGVPENHNLNVRGGRRPRNGLSHAALQRRFTGKMSGVSLGSS
jgi:hypothetical protein